MRENFDALTASQVIENDAPPSAALLPSGQLYTEELFVTTEIAMGVPAYKRAKTLIASSISQMPAYQYKDTTGEKLPSLPILRRPDPNRVRSAFLADLLGDLCDHGIAYALNPQWNTAAGWRYGESREMRKHKSLIYLPAINVAEVTEDGYRIQERKPGSAEVREYQVPAYGIVGFECAAGGWLKDGARAIVTARTLEDSARMYATNPQPTTLLRNIGPRKTPEQVQALLDALETSRRTRSTAYIGRDLELESFGFDANAISLSDARATAILDIARLTGVPSIYLSQGPNEASMMYSNQTQARLDLHATMTPYVTAINERLSMDDITGEGRHVELDLAEWLRVDPTMRADLYAKLVPLGVLTVEEARALEGINTTEVRGN